MTTIDSGAPRRRTSARRRAGGQGPDKAKTSGVQQIAYRHIENWITPIEPTGPEGIDRIHNAALTLLEDVGMEIMGESARECLLKAGAEMHPVGDGARMRFDRAFVESMVALRQPSSRSRSKPCAQRENRWQWHGVFARLLSPQCTRS